MSQKFRYACVMYNREFLAASAVTGGNFDIIMKNLVSKNDGVKYHCDQEGSRFFFEFDGSLVFAVATDLTIVVKQGFDFLDNLKKVFKLQYPDNYQNYEPYGLNGAFHGHIDGLLTRYNANNSSHANDTLSEIQQNLNEAYDKTLDNLSKSMARHDNLTDIEKKARESLLRSQDYYHSTKKIRMKMLFEKYKFIALGIFAALVVIFIVFLILCKGFKCVKKSS